MDLNRPTRDREAQPDAAGRRVARWLHAVERLEDSREFKVGDTRAVVSHADREPAYLLHRLDLGRRSLGCVANRVPHDVLDAAAKQLPVAVEEVTSLARSDDVDAAGLRLARAGGLNLGEKLVEADGLQCRAAGSPSARVISMSSATNPESRSTSF